MDAKDLQKYREEINKIDDEMLKLYIRRMEICSHIGEYKKENALSTYDPDRETEILADVMEKVGNPKFADGAMQLFITLMQSSCELQDRIIADNWEDDFYEDI